MLKQRVNPIVQNVIERYNTVEIMTSMFVTNENAVGRGLLVSGNAGMGKTHFVQLAFAKTGTESRVQYVKGSSMSAASLYVMLYMNKEKGDVLVLDDVDIIHKGASEVATILDMLKGATEPTSGARNIGWMRAAPNPLMIANNVPSEFDFQGAVIWITNDAIEDMRKKTKGHWSAISSRFTQIEAWFEDHEKIAYTMHLIQEMDILGKNCTVKEGGFPNDVVEDTLDYLNMNYRNLKDITPRMAIKIADIREMYPDNWKVYCDNQFITD